ncbi:hypothetical protein ACJX0J_023935, partial [Zea mays]
MLYVVKVILDNKSTYVLWQAKASISKIFILLGEFHGHKIIVITFTRHQLPIFLVLAENKSNLQEILWMAEAQDGSITTEASKVN